MKSIQLAMLVATCSVCALSTPDPQDKTKHPLVGIWGDDSKILKTRYVRVTSQEALTRLWLEHVGSSLEKHSPYYNDAGVPDVDFGTCEVIAIFQGEQWNTAGVRARDLLEESDRLIFRFEDRSFQTAGPDGGGVRATAYGFFVVPKTAKPIALEENVQGLIGRPPKWKERTRL